MSNLQGFLLLETLAMGYLSQLTAPFCPNATRFKQTATKSSLYNTSLNSTKHHVFIQVDWKLIGKIKHIKIATEK